MNTTKIKSINWDKYPEISTQQANNLLLAGEMYTCENKLYMTPLSNELELTRGDCGDVIYRLVACVYEKDTLRPFSKGDSEEIIWCCWDSTYGYISICKHNGH